MGTNLPSHLRLMLVTDDRLVRGRDLTALVREAVRGGVTAVQLRLKLVTGRELARLARLLRTEVPVPVLVNDRPDVAAAAGCGVHLGPEDLPADLARRVLGPDALIGASVGSPSEANEAAQAADYWGVGPWRQTGTKADAGGAIGAEGLRAVVARAGGRPCLAIGGVRPEDVREILAAGASGVAVVSGILAAGDVAEAAEGYAAALGIKRDC